MLLYCFLSRAYIAAEITKAAGLRNADTCRWEADVYHNFFMIHLVSQKSQFAHWGNFFTNFRHLDTVVTQLL